MSRDPLWALTGYVMCCLAAFISLFVVVFVDAMGESRTADVHACLVEQAAVQMDRAVKP